mgnify:CR=1 FL=1
MDPPEDGHAQPIAAQEPDADTNRQLKGVKHKVDGGSSPTTNA